ncbi:MAG: hypothetical protein QNK30_14580 [Bacteroidales bacterium]|nr:hypothetical protein [Bacteroidales bacterium]
MKYLTKILFVLLALNSACKYEFPETRIEYSAGSIDVTRYVGIGDGFSGGFMDGSLYSNGQNNSVASILASQMTVIGLQDFQQPDISSANGYNIIESDESNQKGKWVYSFPNMTQSEPDRILTEGEYPTTYSGDLSLPGNFAVPFARSFELDDPALSANIYYDRFASDPGNSSILTDILIENPSFFTLWIGMNDFLGYATQGGTGNPDPPGDPSLIEEKDLTPVALFQTKISSFLSELLEEPNRKGAILQLPMFDDLPFFYTYPYDFMLLSGTALGFAQSYYSSFNQAVSAHNVQYPDEKRPFIPFNDNGSTLYPQPLVIVDDSLSDAYYPDGITPLPKLRQLNEDEMILLSFPLDKMEFGYGSVDPVTQEYYLKDSQINEIRARIEAFNEVLEQEVNKYPGRLIFVPVSELIHEIAETGKIDSWGRPASDEVLSYNGLPLEGTLGLNSIFSLDGLHFNPRGNALLVNQILKAINEGFGSNLPLVDVNSYLGNTISGN